MPYISNKLSPTATLIFVLDMTLWVLSSYKLLSLQIQWLKRKDLVCLKVMPYVGYILVSVVLFKLVIFVKLIQIWIVSVVLHKSINRSSLYVCKYCYDSLTDRRMVQWKTKYKAPIKSITTSFNYHNRCV